MDLLSQHFVVISYPILTSIFSSTVQRLIFLYSESHYSLHYATLYWPVSPHCIAGLCLPLHVSGQVVVERLGCYLAAARAVGGLPAWTERHPAAAAGPGTGILMYFGLSTTTTTLRCLCSV